MWLTVEIYLCTCRAIFQGTSCVITKYGVWNTIPIFFLNKDIKFLHTFVDQVFKSAFNVVTDLIIGVIILILTQYSYIMIIAHKCVYYQGIIFKKNHLYQFQKYHSRIQHWLTKCGYSELLPSKLKQKLYVKTNFLLLFL